MKHLSSLLISSFLLVPVIGIAGGDSDAYPESAVPTAADWTTTTSITNDTVRPSWLPDRPVSHIPSLGIGAGATFNTVDFTGYSSECSDPAVSDIAFVMLQRLGVCPAPRLSTRL
ncbi:MAG: hypothetical protein PHZ00_00570 [Candidatus Peribacteraceae bacterium]|nr:hypothetical protein [Candidatus Peribacteraceae bacterium]